MLKVLAVIAIVGGIWFMLNSSPLVFLIALAAATCHIDTLIYHRHNKILFE